LDVIFKMRYIVSTIALFIMPRFVSGTARTWVGTTTAWATASNWSPSGAPVSADNLTITATPTGGNFPTISTGTAYANNLIINSGATVNQTGGTLQISNNYKNSGTYTATGGTIEFVASGTTAAIFSLGTNQFYNVIVDAAVDPHFDAAAGGAVSVSGDFTNNNTGLNNSSNITVTFNGTGTQNMYSAATSAKSTFGSLVINKASGSVVLTSNVEVSANATVTSGTFDISSYIFKRTTSGGTITVSNGASLRIGGTGTFPANFTTHTLGATSTEDYYGTTNTVTAETYGNLLLGGSGTKTLPASSFSIAGNFTLSGTVIATAGNAITITGAFTIGSGTTFSAGSYSHSVKGEFSNAGTFNANTSTTTFNGTASQTISGASTTTFYNITINNSNGVTLSTPANVSNLLTMTSGNLVTDNTNFLTCQSGADNWFFIILCKRTHGANGSYVFVYFKNISGRNGECMAWSGAYTEALQCHIRHLPSRDN
jgi:hypothetical protein